MWVLPTVGSNPTPSASRLTDHPPFLVDWTAWGVAGRQRSRRQRPSHHNATVTDDDAMDLALAEAGEAAAHGDVPVGAVVLDGHGALLASGRNRRQLDGDPTAHAEMVALRAAASIMGTWRLDGAVVVCTLEPCPMCAGALVAARVARLVFGAADPKAGACGSLYNLCADPRLNHEVAVSRGVGAEASAEVLAAFFAGRRGGPRRPR